MIYIFFKLVPVTGKIPPVLMTTVIINITKGIHPQIFKSTISGYLMYKRAKPANPVNANDVIKCDMVNKIFGEIFLTIKDGNTRSVHIIIGRYRYAVFRTFN